MAKPPKVQTLAQASKDLNPAYAASKKVIQKKQAGLGAKFDGQRAAINAERGEGFNAINDQATGRGMSFSGIPQHEQARYLSTKYLPGMQQADYQQNEETLTYEGMLADMGKEQRLGAIGRIDQQRQSLNQWNMQQAGFQHTSRENALNRAASAAESAANRAIKTQEAAGPTVDQFLGEAFAKHYGEGGGAEFYTERVLAGQLASAYGMNRKDALKKAYSYRKKYYGE